MFNNLEWLHGQGVARNATISSLEALKNDWQTSFCGNLAGSMLDILKKEQKQDRKTNKKIIDGLQTIMNNCGCGEKGQVFIDFLSFVNKDKSRTDILKNLPDDTNTKRFIKNSAVIIGTVLDKLDKSDNIFDDMEMGL